MTFFSTKYRFSTIVVFNLFAGLPKTPSSLQKRDSMASAIFTVLQLLCIYDLCFLSTILTL